jgi:hypothetical protein
VHRVPVVEKDEVIAIVSQTLLLNFLAKKMTDSEKELDVSLLDSGLFKQGDPPHRVHGDAKVTLFFCFFFFFLIFLFSR